MDLFVLYWVLVGLMGLGALSELIPGMPGASLILVCILIWSVATGFAGMGGSMALVFFILILSAAVEFLATYWGAQRFGASRWGQFGALVGFVLGFVGLLPALPVGGPIVGMLLGPFIGAFIGEYLSRREVPPDDSRVQMALRASVGTVVGSFLGNLLDGLLAIVAVVVFVITTWPFAASLLGS
ncbi:MAG: DUF456 family protein [Cyanobacteria bacterium P01_A01_bin.105]